MYVRMYGGRREGVMVQCRFRGRREGAMVH